VKLKKRRYVQDKKGLFRGSVGGVGENPPTAASPVTPIPVYAKEYSKTFADTGKPQQTYSRFLQLKTIQNPITTATNILVDVYNVSPQTVEQNLEDLLAENVNLPDYALTRGSLEDTYNQLSKTSPQTLVATPDVDPHLADALHRLPARVAQQKMVANVPGIVELGQPGSQANQYSYGPDGRVDKIYYASYGSNLFADRFHAYIAGGKPEGANRTYEGSRDKTLPKDDIPVALNGTIFYAGESRAWTGGVAFLDPGVSGKSLGRAYQITGEQFDDVIAQENWSPVGKTRVDTTTTIRESKLTGRGVYGALVHVGDHNGCPVFTFTSPYSTRQARSGRLSVSPEGVVVGTLAREHSRETRVQEHNKKEAGKPIPTVFQEDWEVFPNKPAPAYINKIGLGLVETHGLTETQVATYFAGSS